MDTKARKELMMNGSLMLNLTMKLERIHGLLPEKKNEKELKNKRKDKKRISRMLKKMLLANYLQQLQLHILLLQKLLL